MSSHTQWKSFLPNLNFFSVANFTVHGHVHVLHDIVIADSLLHSPSLHYFRAGTEEELLQVFPPNDFPLKVTRTKETK